MERLNGKYASVGKRFLAMIIDGLILGFISYLIFGRGDSYTIPSFGMSLGPVILSGLYFIIQESSSRQATLGKRVMNIHIETSDGKDLDFLKATIRFAGKFLSSLILLIGYIMAFFSKENLTLHDRIAKTIVVEDQ